MITDYVEKKNDVLREPKEGGYSSRMTKEIFDRPETENKPDMVSGD